jgi:Carboxylesterase family
MTGMQLRVTALTLGMFVAAAHSRQSNSISGIPPDAPAGNAPVVTTSSGDVEGTLENHVFAFKGIPYASPPVGDLRWRDPQAPAPWQGVRKTTAYANACIQVPGLSLATVAIPALLAKTVYTSTSGRRSWILLPNFPSWFGFTEGRTYSVRED